MAIFRPVGPTGMMMKFVPRETLRFMSHGRKFALPRHLNGLMGAWPQPVIPYDWSKGSKIRYPMLGNDSKGDCFFTSACHGAQTFTGNASTECSFDTASVVNRYLQLSGGDNGLNDQIMMPEWKGGIVGPHGPHTILDELTIDVSDMPSVEAGLYFFCGGIWTVSLYQAWLNGAKPGFVFDVVHGQRPDPQLGHAMWLSGFKKNFDVQTWEIQDPSIQVTQAGIQAADSEIIIAFSLEMFNAQGLTPTGQTYDQAARLWEMSGGQTLPPSPFGPPAPTPTPVPVPVPTPTPIPTPTPVPVPPVPTPTPIPVPPVPVPVPPSPVPVPGPSILAAVQQAFQMLLARFANRPRLVRIIQMIENYVLAYLKQQGMNNKPAGSGSLPSIVIGIIQQAFAQAERQWPSFGPMLAMVEMVLLQMLSQHN